MIVLLLLHLVFVVGSYAKPVNDTADGNVELCDYQGKVVGGQPASDGQFPYQAELQRQGGHYCGGSIYTNRWIVTAAHCIDKVNPREFRIKVGSIKVHSNDGQILQVAKMIAHPQYQGPPLHQAIYDIGVVQTASDIIFNQKVQPIRLGTHEVGGGKRVVLSGWGKHHAQGQSSSVLYYINLNTIDNNACRKSWPKFYDHYLCTYTKYGEGSCFGDSGGPLVENGVLVGVVSFGQPCAIGVPDVFTRVSSFINWIQMNARP